MKHPVKKEQDDDDDEKEERERERERENNQQTGGVEWSFKFRILILILLAKGACCKFNCVWINKEYPEEEVDEKIDLTQVNLWIFI